MQTPKSVQLCLVQHVFILYLHEIILISCDSLQFNKETPIFNNVGFFFYFLFFKINLFILFIYFWLCWVFVAVHGLSLVVASGGYSLLRCTCFSLRWLLLLRITVSRCAGSSSCGTWAQQLWFAGSGAQVLQLWCTGLVAPRNVRSSRTRVRTRVPCIGRWILNHCATREVQEHVLLIILVNTLVPC